MKIKNWFPSCENDNVELTTLQKKTEEIYLKLLDSYESRSVVFVSDDAFSVSQLIEFFNWIFTDQVLFMSISSGLRRGVLLNATQARSVTITLDDISSMDICFVNQHGSFLYLEKSFFDKNAKSMPEGIIEVSCFQANIGCIDVFNSK